MLADIANQTVNAGIINVSVVCAVVIISGRDTRRVALSKIAITFEVPY